jgi:hypothetical protein
MSEPANVRMRSQLQAWPGGAVETRLLLVVIIEVCCGAGRRRYPSGGFSLWPLAAIPGPVVGVGHGLARCGAQRRLPSRARWPQACRRPPLAKAR